ncbi:GrpB family protein [Ureibacillus sp. GCM10028918]|uniref:GrpB family protein n=1 Tax=Ureibacillus sp. GCM10028918 TaxID=3273429 RepID=UPI00360EBDDA
MRKAKVYLYDKNWIIAFSQESELIKGIFGGELLNIYHIGSTSIPGMAAKPIIDILIEVQEINTVDSFNREMKKLGYIPRGENGIKNRRYFVKEKDDKRTHHIHIYQTGAKEIIKHLAFRDYLIENQTEAEQYKVIKQEISQIYPHNVKLYQEQKSLVVNNLTEKALLWAGRNKKTSVTGFILREKETNNFELLSLSFQSIPNASWRVPGGGVEKNENLVDALYREIKEETGLIDLTLIREMGVLHYYKPYIKRIVERHDFLLLAPPNTADSWNHIVTGKDKDQGMVFEYKWLRENDFLNIDGELRSFLIPKYIPELFD